MVDKDTVKKEFEEKQIRLINISYTDLAGITRAKTGSAEFADQILKDGLRFAKAAAAGNSVYTPTSVITIDDLSLATGDVKLVPDLNTLAFPEYASGVAKFIGDFYEVDGSPWPLCTRGVLRRVLEDARSLGYKVQAGFEVELHLVRREGATVVPWDHSGGQSQVGFDGIAAFSQELQKALEDVNVKILKMHIEGGCGQYEYDLYHSEGLKAADDVANFKDCARMLARRKGFICSFMPKIGEGFWGSGMHLHISLIDADSKRNVFADDGDDRGLGLNQICYNFIGGVLKHVRGLCAIAAPSVNSYKRLLRGRWAADAAVYGLGHRGAAIRIPDGVEERCRRIEFRVPDPSCNPYLTLATTLAAGLEGIKKKIDPGDPVDYDLGSMSEDEVRSRGFETLPATLHEALEDLREDTFIRDFLGELLVRQYLFNRMDEWQHYCDQVTSWEVERFLESI